PNRWIGGTFSRSGRRRVSALLYPELIHAHERVGPLRLEGVPPVKIAHEPVAAENAAIVLERLRRELEADESQAVRCHEGLDLRNRGARFLDMKQQIATFAGAEEIADSRDALKRRAQQLLPAAANVVEGCTVAVLGNESARRDDVATRKLA